MTAFHPPILSAIQARYTPESTPLQKRLYKYMRPYDQPVNVYVNSDNTVTTDYAVPITPTAQNGEATISTVLVLLPFTPTTVGPPEGAEGGPFGTNPYSDVYYNIAGDNPVHVSSSLPVYIKYWFRGGCTYPNISANLVTLLTNAGFGAYLV